MGERREPALKPGGQAGEPATGNRKAQRHAFAREWTVDEWKRKASAVDNHWLDCLVGCAAAASMLGVSLFRGATPKKVKRKRKHVAYL